MNGLVTTSTMQYTPSHLKMYNGFSLTIFPSVKAEISFDAGEGEIRSFQCVPHIKNSYNMASEEAMAWNIAHVNCFYKQFLDLTVIVWKKQLQEQFWLEQHEGEWIMAERWFIYELNRVGLWLVGSYSWFLRFCFLGDYSKIVNVDAVSPWERAAVVSWGPCSPSPLNYSWEMLKFSD